MKQSYGLLSIGIVGDKLCDGIQTAMQDVTQLVERMRGDGHILLEPLDGCMTHAVLEAERVCREALRRHRLPERFIANHNSIPLYRGHYAHYNSHNYMAII